MDLYPRITRPNSFTLHCATLIVIIFTNIVEYHEQVIVLIILILLTTTTTTTTNISSRSTNTVIMGRLRIPIILHIKDCEEMNV